MVRRLPRVLSGEADSASVNYQLADLLLENKDFGEAAKQYERTLTDTRSIRSRQLQDTRDLRIRAQLKVADKKQQDAVKRDTVAARSNLPMRSAGRTRRGGPRSGRR